jgi:regulator of cell morphogenesis and NO signaling
MNTSHKNIEELIDENFVYAKVLHYFGIHFYENRSKTLNDVCTENNIDQKSFNLFMENIKNTQTIDKLQLNAYPVKLIVEYLKHAHQIFIKDKLPYILSLLNNIQGNSAIINDLKFVLPMFVEDFIKHIYEEEDRLFQYLLKLEQMIKQPSKLNLFAIKKHAFSIQEFALHHDDSDQEMSGIRGITHNYTTESLDDLKVKVLFEALKSFDLELENHANIENEVLFPKALALEKLALSKIQHNSTLN